MPSSTTYHDLVEPHEFSAKLNLLQLQIAPLPKDPNCSVSTYVEPDVYEFVESLFNAALKAEKDGERNVAWCYLVEAASQIGFHRGISEANFLNSAGQGVVELLKQNGKSGGEAKGRNTERKRGALASRLVETAPDGKWPSKETFEAAFHKLAKEIPGFYASNHQLRKIMQRDDIKAIVTASPKRRR